MLPELPDIVFEGHALVSADGMIADGNSHMPPSLRVDADWAQFQAALERSVIVASGRKGHETHPNPTRRRLVLTRLVEALEPGVGNATMWNPSGMPLGEALRTLGITRGTVAIAGVFDFFVPWYDVFVLSEMHRLVLPGGTPCFTTGHPRTVLAEAGLQPGALNDLDAAAEVTTTIWHR
jgi:hypothetical protein